MGKKALFLGPGGPFGAVEIGALKAFHEKGIKFDIIAGNSIGSAIALTYASPAQRYKGDSIKALNDLKNYTSLETSLVSLTKKIMPFNFRIWHKTWGRENEIYEKIMENILTDDFMEMFEQLPKIWQDSIGFWTSLCTPVNLQCEYSFPYNALFKSIQKQSLPDFYLAMMSAMIPKSNATGFIVPLHAGMRKIIDFEALKQIDQEIFIGALNLNNREPVLFSKHEITPLHLQASTTVIFMNEICRINDTPYAESTYVDAYNFREVLQKHPDIDTIVLIDILGMRSWVYEPKDLVDAFNVSITGGFANSARDDLAVFEERYLNRKDEQGQFKFHNKNINYVKVQYEVPQDIHPTWSIEVMNRLDKVGYDAALNYLDII
ncbi:patatin-like phospholipase family protein [Desulfobacterales bacterium HSG17]|nr:patatin-like phospholipase family protein [Desulfobacterales bacterium HSG17]